MFTQAMTGLSRRTSSSPNPLPSRNNLRLVWRRRHHQDLNQRKRVAEKRSFARLRFDRWYLQDGNVLLNAFDHSPLTLKVA
jgi:hypothetical protein